MLSINLSKTSNIRTLLFSFTESPELYLSCLRQTIDGYIERSRWEQSRSVLLEAYEEHQLDAAAEFYDSIANKPNALWSYS